MNEDSADHEHIDGCLCGSDHVTHVATADIDLPAARGGVAGDRRPRKLTPKRSADKKDAD